MTCKYKYEIYAGYKFIQSKLYRFGLVELLVLHKNVYQSNKYVPIFVVTFSCKGCVPTNLGAYLQIGQKFFKCRNQSHDRHLPANPTLDITDQSFGVLANNDLNWCGPSGLEKNCRNETGFHKNIGDFFRTYMLRLEKTEVGRQWTVGNQVKKFNMTSEHQHQWKELMGLQPGYEPLMLVVQQQSSKMNYLKKAALAKARHFPPISASCQEIREKKVGWRTTPM